LLRAWSTILGTNGLNSADVPLSNKQTNKTNLISGGFSVVFLWVPSHVGLAGNSAADSAAKDALLLPVSNLIRITNHSYVFRH